MMTETTVDSSARGQRDRIRDQPPTGWSKFAAFGFLCFAAVLLISSNDFSNVISLQEETQTNVQPKRLHAPRVNTSGGMMNLAELSARLAALPTDDDLEELREEMAQAVADKAAHLNEELEKATSCSFQKRREAEQLRTQATSFLDETKAQWAKFVAKRDIDNPSPGIKYCLWQCNDDKCCPGGYRTADHFLVIRDNMQQYDADDGVSDVTLVTQGTSNRIPMFASQAARWPGPKVVVFAVYNHTLETHASAAIELAQIREASRSWENVRVLAFIIEHIGPTQDSYSAKMVDPKLTLYPINALRNMVVDQARTNWVFPADVDFIPSTHLYHRMIDLILPRLANVERVALVVPHFELLENYKVHSETPGDFAELDSALLLGKIVPFHSDPQLVLPRVETDSNYERQWPHGLAATNYSRWYQESKYGLLGFSRITPSANPYAYTSKFWEPFLFARRVEAKPTMNLPRYQERYVGRFRNKVEWVRTLRADHYRFYNLLQEHLIHMPHEVLLSNKSDPDAKTMQTLMFGVDDNRVREIVDEKSLMKAEKKRIPKNEGLYQEGWHCRP